MKGSSSNSLEWLFTGSCYLIGEAYREEMLKRLDCTGLVVLQNRYGCHLRDVKSDMIATEDIRNDLRELRNNITLGERRSCDQYHCSAAS